jgi:hypothetical protein
MFRSLARRQPRARRSHRRSWTIPSGGSTICLPCSWKKFRRHCPNVLKDLTQVTVPDCQPLMLPLLRSAINGDSVSQGRGLTAPLRRSSPSPTTASTARSLCNCSISRSRPIGELRKPPVASTKSISLIHVCCWVHQRDESTTQLFRSSATAALLT